jgi:SHS2 domain-containing protein
MRQVDVTNEYVYLDHPADMLIEAYGKTLAHAFTSTGRALINTWANMTLEEKTCVANKRVHVVSPRLTALLYDYLTQLLVLVETEQFCTCAIEELTITRVESGFSLSCTLQGKPFDSTRMTHAIKAVTYHQMSIDSEHTIGPFCIRVVLDV